MAAPFSHDRFHARSKVFDISPKFLLYDLQGQQIGYLKKKLFKLKEDIRLYADETMAQELLTIKARKIMDWSSAYDVVDSLSQQKVGTLKRKGMKSILRDEWIILDAADREIGIIREDSTALALVRRFLTNIIPQKFIFEAGGQIVGTARQAWNPFVLKMDVDMSADTACKLDRRLVAAIVVLLLAVEGRQG
jgi:uncharacterized protein YxjI